MNVPATTTVSVVIPAYGRDPWLERSVASVLASTGVEADAIVVDNGCDRDAADRLAALPRVTVLQPGTNLGFAGGCNAGARAASGDVVVFLNQDAVLDPGALSVLYDVASRPDVGIATACIRLAEPPGAVNTAGNPLHFLGFCWAGGYGDPPEAHRVEREVAAASGTAMALRREVWERLGGFADEYFAYQEDTELSVRCWQRGLRVVYAPRATVTHRYEFSRNRSKWYLLERNRLLLVLTTYEARTLALVLPAVVGVEAGMLLVAVRGGWGREKLRGWAWLVRNRSWTAQRRRQLQAERLVGDRALAHRLAVRFAAPTLDLPRWARPVDAALAAYWSLVRRML